MSANVGGKAFKNSEGLSRKKKKFVAWAGGLKLSPPAGL
jgi:hypothetical protein